MKKTLLLISFACISLVQYAQNGISDYSFYQSFAEYTPVSGTSITLNPNTAISILHVEDEGISDAIDIGFSFSFGNYDYTQFRVSANGFLSLGEVDFTSDEPLLSSLNSSEFKIIAPVRTDLWTLFDYDASIDYLLEGELGSQILTIQFANIREWGNTDQASIDYQIKLYESNNQIEFIYGDMSGAAPIGSEWDWSFQQSFCSCGISDNPSNGGSYLSINPGYPCEYSSFSEFSYISTSQLASIIEGTVFYFVPKQELDARPISIDINSTITYNELLSPVVSFENHGTQPISFDASIEIINSSNVILYTQTETITDLAASTSHQITYNPDWTAVAGDFTVKAYTDLTNDAYIANDTITKQITVSYLKKAYCYVLWSESDMYNTGASWFYLEEPDEINSTLDNNETILNGAWAEEKWYSIEFPSHDLVYFDTETGAKTIVGNTGFTGLIFYGLTYDWSSSTMYAITGFDELSLYTIDLVTGNSTLVGTADDFPGKMITLAANLDGDLFSISETGILYSINKTDGNITSIGTLGLSSLPSGSQDMEFDHYSNTLYWYASLSGGFDAMYTVNTATGIASLTSSSFDYQVQLCGFAIPYSPTASFSVTFDITDNLEADVSLNDYGTQTANGGTTTFTTVAPSMSPGIMYTVEYPNYVPYTGFVVVDNNEAITITLQPLGDTYNVTFNITDGLEPNITLGSYGTQTATGGTYTFMDIDATASPGIVYIIELDGYETIYDYVIVDENEIVNINMIITNLPEDIKNNISISPNPSNGIIKIENLNSISDQIKYISITDILGQETLLSTNTNQDTFDISKFEQGMYFINIHTQNGIITKKIILNN